MTSDPLDIQAIREHFTFPGLGRLLANNAATTQPPRELLALYASLAAGYDNVHRGQSSSSQKMTALFEDAYDTIAAFIGAPSRASITLNRNTKVACRRPAVDRWGCRPLSEAEPGGHGHVVSALRAVVETRAAFDAYHGRPR